MLAAVDLIHELSGEHRISRSIVKRDTGKMTVMNEYAGRISSLGAMSCLEEKFEIIKDIGDGSFGSVALARVRTAGAHVARRGTMVSPTRTV